MNRISINKSSPLKGDILVPGDKSISHRAAIFASIAEGESKIKNFLRAEDCMSTLGAMRSMGIETNFKGDYLSIKGAGMKGLQEPEDVIDAGNSGTTIRLLAGLLAGQDFYCVINGDSYLRKRPMSRVVHPLTKMGAKIWGREGGDKSPLAILGSKLHGIDYDSPIASAQVKSSILLAALSAEGKTTVREPYKSRDHTERMLLAMGIRGGVVDRGFYVEGGGTLRAHDIDVPGDISSAAFFIVAALIVERSEVRIRHVGINPTRTGILDVLIQMGANIVLENEAEVGGEPVADIIVKSSSLKGVEIKGDIIPRVIDEIPILCVAASLANGKTVIRDAGELRVKESDRIRSMTSELSKLGASVEELDDGMIIVGRESLTGNVVNSLGDHRIAMSMAVSGLIAGSETIIEGAESIKISFPEFFDILSELQR